MKINQIMKEIDTVSKGAKQTYKTVSMLNKALKNLKIEKDTIALFDGNTTKLDDFKKKFMDLENALKAFK
jgi:uncharacterized phage infection (PIP) family protein YhgE